MKKSDLNIYCIIVSFNAEEWIQNCLDSVLASTQPCKILVVDNCSSDQTCSIIKSQYENVELIELSSNLGFGKANNIGLKLAYERGAEYFLLLNQDAWINKETISSLVEQQLENPEFGIISPLQYFNETQLDAKFEKYLKFANKRSKNSKTNLVQVPFVNAAIWLMHRSSIEQVGLFAPIFNHYGEDLNFAHRCKYHSIKVGIAPDVIGFHARPQGRNFNRHQHISNLYKRDQTYCLGILLNIKHSFARQVLFLFMNSLKMLLVSIFHLRFKQLLVITARMSALFSSVELLKQRKIMKHKGAFLNEE